MENTKNFRDRLAQLRMQKGVSARDMSLSLGQSESYINKIENQRTMPSMIVFFYICDYLGITPKEFFDVELVDPVKNRELAEAISKLTPEQSEHVLSLVKDILK